MKFDMDKIRIEVYTMTTCPHCPPVKAYCEDLPCSKVFFDETGPQFEERAKKLGVEWVPVVFVFSDKGEQLGKYSSVEELKEAGF